MNPLFREIYREQIEFYRGMQVRTEPWWLEEVFSQNSLRALAIVNEAIDEALAILPPNKQLRPDAKLFLIVNLHQLVILPLSDRRSPTKLTSDVEAGIKLDVKTILKAAIEQVPDRSDISASHIVWGLSRVLNDLSLKSWRLWETDE